MTFEEVSGGLPMSKIENRATNDLDVRRGPAPETVGLDLPPLVLGLGDKRALDPDIAGAKAANLARAMQGGFTVLDGFVVTVEGTRVFSTQRARQVGRDLEKLLKKRWAALSADGTHPLVVRSSSSAEDGHDSAMAGMFTSVLDVATWADFRRAMQTVVESARIVDLVEERETFAPMAVLVQPQLAPDWGGVLFGVDPVTGRTDHLVVAAVEGRPDSLVSGTVEGERYVLTHSGRVVDRSGGGLSKSVLKRLTKLAERAAGHFGGPQDVEWALVGDDLVMLQSRPVTAVAEAQAASGPVLGPGPVSETFPRPLTTLEVDLWVEPLRVAVAEVLSLTGAASHKILARSPVVTTVGGRVAADLRLLGAFPGKKTFFETIDPRPPARRLAAAWRTGRLRAALPSIAAAMIEKVDDDLAAVPELDAIDDVQLVEVLRRCRQALVSLHAHEVMFGLLADEEYTVTAASLGLKHLAAARTEGFTDEDVVAMRPEVLALVPPSIFSDAPLPPTDGLAPRAQDEGALPQREALRLRARWVQELSARAARVLARRLHESGRVEDPRAVAELTFDELETASSLGPVPPDVSERQGAAGPPLPAAFRLTDAGDVVVYHPRRKTRAATAGTGASSGRAEGIVHSGEGVPQKGQVLVVSTLDPDLATLLPRLGALVAETGSVLSHLAIMAREYGIPAVVGVPDALTRFPAGARVSVDGTTGEVTLVEEAGS
ncbi:MAG TPA: PEP/pyruvate-binding domain-containing protein [Actinomycetota bacterium]|nr:PEP/pyruvate-binding domain-containing protein [Actinomycetota bacterium]